MDYGKKSLELHSKHNGKMSIVSDVPLLTKDDLSMAYTPGVAEVCKAILEDKNQKYRLTSIGKTIAVVSNGTAVLGLGNIGPEAAYPVMEGKAILFKEFGGVNAIPICLPSSSIEEFIDDVEKLSINYAGINLEDIKAPECFIIEEELKERLNIPVFHDDQHGTAIVVMAGLINALKLSNRNMKDIKVVVNGSGAAGGAIAKMLADKVKELLVVDSKGILTPSRQYGNMENLKRYLSKYNKNGKEGDLLDALHGADVFIGVSKPNLLKKKHISVMNKNPIIFALANPDPEITYDKAKEYGVSLIATGRSDYPNQINNVLVFPGIFKGALLSGAKQITEEMKIAAARAIANTIIPTEERFIPDPFDKRVHENVIKAVIEATK